MSKRRTISIVAGTGTLMLTLCLTTALIHLNEWTKTHASTVTQTMYGSGVIAVACFLIWLFMHESDRELSSQPPTTVTSNSIISPTISPVFAPVFNNAPSIPVPSEEITSNIIETLLMPHLVALDIENVIPQEHSAAYANVGTHLCLLPIENRIPDEKKTFYIENICASIRFQGIDGLSGSVSRAYWYQFLENEISFPVSSSRSVVIGSRVNGRWFYYQNPNQFRPQYGRGSGGTIRAAEVKSLPFGNAPIQAEVIVFNRRTADVYVKQKIRIDLISEDIVNIVRLL